MSKFIKTIDVSCNSCGASVFSEIAKAKDFGYETCANEFIFVQCDECNLVYLRNRPDVSELSTIYPKNYIAYNYDEALGGFINWARNQVQKLKVRPIRKYMKSGGLIADVGCGSAHFLNILKKHGDSSWKLVGIDISPEAIAHLKRHGLQGVLGRFESLDWKLQSPTVIVMNQMIEHFEDPKAVVKKAFELLEPGGVIILETPSLEGWDTFLFRRRYWGGWHTPRHWCIYTERTLGSLLSQNGFEVVEVNYLANPWSWLHSFQYSIGDGLGLKKISKLFEVTNVFALALAVFIDVIQKVMRRKTSNMRIVARKPK